MSLDNTQRTHFAISDDMTFECFQHQNSPLRALSAIELGMTTTPESADRSPADPIKEASIAILHERFRENDSMSAKEMIYAVYANATPTPDDAHPAVKITEDAFKQHYIAVALFHEQEAVRFQRALKEARAAK